MTDNQSAARRFAQLIEALKISQRAVAQRLGFTPGYISPLVRGDKPLSGEVIKSIAENFPEVNLHWLLTGQGEMMVGKNNSEKTAAFLGTEPSISDVERLMEAVKDHFQPDLNVKQELKLQQACLRVLVDNPGQPWASLVVGAGVYLRFIEEYPNLAIPEGREPGGGDESR